MWLVALGALQIVLYLAGLGPFAHWTWELTGDMWKFLWPFIGASIWWLWAEQSGYNARKEMERLDQRRAGRRLKNLANLGNLRKNSKNSR